MEGLTVTVNNRTYELSDSFRSDIEQIAENQYGDNHLLDYYWRAAGSDEDDHAYGDPLLCIETEGHQVPWDNISEFSLDESPVPGMMLRGPPSKNPGDSDNGNGVATMPPTPHDDDEMEDYKLVMFPRDFGQPYPDPNDGKLSTLPPMPDSLDDADGPVMVVPIPEDTRPERWAAGQAIVPAFTAVEWNLQRRADTALSIGSHRGGDSHDKWERWMKRLDCTVVDTSGEDGMGKEQRKRMYSDDADLGPKYGPSASNFRV